MFFSRPLINSQRFSSPSQVARRLGRVFLKGYIMKKKLEAALENVMFDINAHFKEKKAWPLAMEHYISYLVRNTTGIDFFMELTQALIPKYKVYLQENQFMIVKRSDKHEGTVVIQSSKRKGRTRNSSKGSKSTKRSK